MGWANRKKTNTCVTSGGAAAQSDKYGGPLPSYSYYAQ